ncbi:hypothetical protein L3Q82_009183 [Scortum barcoo]|uniref:Uncharacterized protein n=1 Tax=Scortum barcoo TaxID=214431 RepID=A0ACB8WFK2_9TELE|nr:hypothetical protein L3Q82_009183 [Scortum barcoo]
MGRSNCHPISDRIRRRTAGTDEASWSRWLPSRPAGRNADPLRACPPGHRGGPAGRRNRPPEHRARGRPVGALRWTTDPLDCPTCGKKMLARLDKHLAETHGLATLEEREPLITHAKRLAIAREFAWLRARNPQDPLVSTLGLCSADDEPLEQLPAEESPGCSTPVPQQQRRRRRRRRRRSSTARAPRATSADVWSWRGGWRRWSAGGCPRVWRWARPRRSCSARHRPRRRGEHVVKSKKGALYEKVIQDFGKFRLGSRTGRRDIDNAPNRRATHCLRYCQYMAEGLPETSTSADLRFLVHMDKLRRYPTFLKEKGYMPTTIKNMMINVTQLYKHIDHSFQQCSRLTGADIQSGAGKAGTSSIPAQELAFLAAAKRRVPQLFHDLSTSSTGGTTTTTTTTQNEHAKLIGYIMGYLCVISGHRAVVLTNMLVDHVFAADSWRDGRRFQILVDEHKTVKSFGQASLVLNAREFDWVKRLAEGKCCPPGREGNNVFHTVLGGPIMKPNSFLHMAWVDDAGCRGTVNFAMR